MLKQMNVEIVLMFSVLILYPDLFMAGPYRLVWYGSKPMIKKNRALYTVHLSSFRFQFITTII